MNTGTRVTFSWVLHTRPFNGPHGCPEAPYPLNIRSQSWSQLGLLLMTTALGSECCWVVKERHLAALCKSNEKPFPGWNPYVRESLVPRQTSGRRIMWFCSSKQMRKHIWKEKAWGQPIAENSFPTLKLKDNLGQKYPREDIYPGLVYLSFIFLKW